MCARACMCMRYMHIHTWAGQNYICYYNNVAWLICTGEQHLYGVDSVFDQCLHVLLLAKGLQIVIMLCKYGDNDESGEFKWCHQPNLDTTNETLSLCGHNVRYNVEIIF